MLENVPVLSYVALGGRCSACHWKIPLRYPIVEIGGALVGAVAALHFGIGAAAAGACVLGLGLLALSAIDFENQLLPDAITLPLLWLGLAFNLFDTFSTLRDGVLGVMAGYVVLWTVYHAFKFVTGRSGMGYGDFKLLALIGAWLGWQALPGVILLGSLAGGHCRRRAGRVRASLPRRALSVRSVPRRCRSVHALLWRQPEPPAGCILGRNDLMRSRAMIVALTGGLATGKSAVAERFEELGVPVIDADVVTRRLVEPGRLPWRKSWKHLETTFSTAKGASIAPGCASAYLAMPPTA